jgi:NAD dependent epimerase/dehydratase family enzyme
MGVVLGKDGGFFKKIDGVFRRRVGFVINCDEGFSFIHIGDLLNVFGFVIKHREIEGIINASAPNIVSILRFFEIWTDRRDCFIVVNLMEPFLRFLWGEAADVLVVGQNVKPVKLQQSGFVFKFPDAEISIQSLL